MKNIKFSKDNWSGGSSVVKINEKTGEFTLSHMTEKFKLKLTATEDFENIFEILLVEKKSLLKLGTVYHNYVNDCSDAVGNGGVDRQHTGKYSHYVAAAKLICNVL